jgi:predicted GIY-YIG superfamily endonuclease
MADTIYWEGASGKKYQYWIYPIGSSFKKEPGNYIFAKKTPTSWNPVYIGQTDNLDERLGNHNEEQCAKRNGATHIHAHTTASKAARLAEEADLIRKWKPVCNDQIP